MGHLCESVLNLPHDVLTERRRNIINLVQTRHTLDQRIDTIITTAEALMACRNGEIDKCEALRRIKMWHFLPEIKLEEEYEFAVANWQG